MRRDLLIQTASITNKRLGFRQQVSLLQVEQVISAYEDLVSIQIASEIQTRIESVSGKPSSFMDEVRANLSVALGIDDETAGMSNDE